MRKVFAQTNTGKAKWPLDMDFGVSKEEASSAGLGTTKLPSGQAFERTSLRSLAKMDLIFVNMFRVLARMRLGYNYVLLFLDVKKRHL